MSRLVAVRLLHLIVRLLLPQYGADLPSGRRMIEGNGPAMRVGRQGGSATKHTKQDCCAVSQTEATVIVPASAA
jgi:hypothetical protein